MKLVEDSQRQRRTTVAVKKSSGRSQEPVVSFWRRWMSNDIIEAMKAVNQPTLKGCSSRAKNTPRSAPALRSSGGTSSRTAWKVNWCWTMASASS